MTPAQDLSDFSTLVDIIARLRGPGGCPWDRQQTHASMRDSLLEECYEVLEALDEGAARRLSVELGDLLMQIVFTAR
jgi:tetrapyrrole methylase family protein/MazG family protein